MKNLPKINPSKALKVSLPYLIAGLLCTKLGGAYRLTTGGDVIDRLLAAFTKLGLVFQNPFPSLHPFDLLVGAAAAVPCHGGCAPVAVWRAVAGRFASQNRPFCTAKRPVLVIG